MTPLYIVYIYIYIGSLRCLWQTHRLLLRNIPEVRNVGGARDKNGEITSKVKVKKVHTLGIAPLRESSPQKRSSMARVLKGSLSFTCTPTRSSAIGMSHTCLCQCLKWSKKEAGSLPQSEVECPSPDFFSFIFDVKMASSMHYWWYFMRFRATRK